MLFGRIIPKSPLDIANLSFQLLEVNKFLEKPIKLDTLYITISIAIAMNSFMLSLHGTWFKEEVEREGAKSHTHIHTIL